MANIKDLEPERLARLNDEQRAIVLSRMEKTRERSSLLDQLSDTNDPEVHQHIFDLFKDTDSPECEHGRSIWKPCIACLEIEQLLFPEYYNDNGEPIED